MPDWQTMPRTQHLKDTVVSGDSHCPNSKCESVSYGCENTKPQHTWERYYLLKFAMGCPTEMCELLWIPGWDKTTQMPLGSHCFCYKPDLLKCTVPGIQCRKREKVGIPIWHIPPPVHLLTLDSAAFPSQPVWYTQPGQIPTEGSGHKCNFFWKRRLSHTSSY